MQFKHMRKAEKNPLCKNWVCIAGFFFFSFNVLVQYTTCMQRIQRDSTILKLVNFRVFLYRDCFSKFFGKLSTFPFIPFQQYTSHKRYRTKMKDQLEIFERFFSKLSIKCKELGFKEYANIFEIFSKIIFCSCYFVVDFELHEYVSCTIVTLIIHIKHRGWDSSWQKNLMKCTVSMNSNWDVACKN